MTDVVLYLIAGKMLLLGLKLGSLRSQDNLFKYAIVFLVAIRAVYFITNALHLNDVMIAYRQAEE